MGADQAQWDWRRTRSEPTRLTSLSAARPAYKYRARQHAPAGALLGGSFYDAPPMLLMG